MFSNSAATRERSLIETTEDTVALFLEDLRSLYRLEPGQVQLSVIQGGLADEKEQE